MFVLLLDQVAFMLTGVLSHEQQNKQYGCVGDITLPHFGHTQPC